MFPTKLEITLLLGAGALALMLASNCAPTPEPEVPSCTSCEQRCSPWEAGECHLEGGGADKVRVQCVCYRPEVMR